MIIKSTVKVTRLFYQLQDENSDIGSNFYLSAGSWLYADDNDDGSDDYNDDTSSPSSLDMSSLRKRIQKQDNQYTNLLLEQQSIGFYLQMKIKESYQIRCILYYSIQIHQSNMFIRLNTPWVRGRIWF